ncbi:MAG: FtsQ-type POTRA domain-containing protein, partial [Firmicutes bacterium]|nr:FtsQ-type POTRA domain-containing protein [Bacillota bacterium]
MAKKKKTKVRETTKKPVAKKKKKRKILYGRILFACLFLAVIAYGVIYFLPQNIRSITVSGNDYLTEQEVIELAKLESYPSTYTNYGYKIKVELEKSPFIKKASVSKKWIFQVAIQIEENRPIFYDITKKKAVLEDGETIDGDFEIPLLINYTPDKIY